MATRIEPGQRWQDDTGNVLEIGSRVASGDDLWATRDPSTGDGGHLAVMTSAEIRRDRSVIERTSP